MGVSGSGKTSVGRALARRIGARFVEGDDLHPDRNRKAMAAGHPLDDGMRRDWLDALGDHVAATPGRAVVACSALKRRYRDGLRARLGPLDLAWQTGPAPLLLARVSGREGHYFPAALLDEQLADLEPPRGEPRCLILDIRLSVPAQVRRAALRFG